MSVALLFEGNNELPGFHTVGQQDLLWEESVHIKRDVQVFPLHVRHKCVFKATRTKKTFKIIMKYLQSTHDVDIFTKYDYTKFTSK